MRAGFVAQLEDLVQYENDDRAEDQPEHRRQGSIGRPSQHSGQRAGGNLDRVLEIAQARYPQRVVQFASQEPDSTDVWYVTMTPSPAPTRSGWHGR